MIGRYIAIIICSLCVAASLSFSIGIGFIYGVGIGFLTFFAMCVVMIIASAIFARIIALEIGGDEQ